MNCWHYNTLNNWAYWFVWVGLNAISSLIFASIVFHHYYNQINLWAYFGVLISYLMIVFGFVSLENDLIRSDSVWQEHLRKAVQYKAFFQISYMATVPLGLEGGYLLLAFVPEIYTGALAMSVAEDFFIASSQPFWFALFSTLLTAFFMSILVWMIAFCHYVFKTRKEARQHNVR